jgi:MoaA/NifB/PqqE/SkfB family radical SAM enzyme
MAAFCPSAHLAFAFTEPLAWAPLGEALAYAKTLGLQASITTNGLLLPRRAGELADGRCRNLSVSLDGPQDVHDRIRRKEGSFARAVAGIEAVDVTKGAPDIAVFCTITEWNVGSLREFLRDMRSLPLKRVGLIHNNFVSVAQAEYHNAVYDGFLHATPSNVFETAPAEINLELLSEELQEISRTEYPFPVSIQPNRTALDDLKTYYRNPEVFIGRRCQDASRILMIDPDGEAIPVHGRCFRFPISNIQTHSLKEIWHHERLVELRRTLKSAGGLLPACSRCCSGFG